MKIVKTNESNMQYLFSAWKETNQGLVFYFYLVLESF
jgi:hypothetical protein